ncbi:DUF4397 domain-containing protein [Bacillus licheniformis]|uniref:DUF4397 domain-containing protein n=1 Tax=Bacillus licheniformis TaxID=1402 RepID=UPI002330EC9B|nr:DUF4397 domain-containing protein [Bacillus licheniformis]
MFSAVHNARYMAEGFQGSRYDVLPAEAPFYFRNSGKAVMIRLLHAAPHTDNLDVFVNGISVFRNVSYTDLSSYVRFPAGRIQIDVFRRGWANGPLLTVQYHLIHGRYCTVAVTGTAAKLVPVGMYDQPAADPESRSIRCVHLSPDSPALDFAVQNGPVLFSGVPFQSVTRYIPVRSQKMDVELRGAGSTAVLLKAGPEDHASCRRIHNVVWPRFRQRLSFSRNKSGAVSRQSSAFIAKKKRPDVSFTVC